ncbi:hypothetical protein U3A58_19295 [Algoriphagus sp. C2-6-M1]|uniref:hypothetical protein n=1 Tax=Algoriphagus persicinus TaxID=3108754 RepID=UPI002B395833|nr:hypothetical protein [Algoriphagus sp. C2-6-M1]MEB2782543.1 hypothetical protein [Algoriphagus sp. C2-6-M1]
MRKKSYDRSDKELDDMLRKISESAQIPFSEEDWGEMRARLDQASTPPPAWVGRKGLGWAGVILMTVLISMVSWNYLRENQDADQHTSTNEIHTQLSGLNSGESEFEKNQAKDHSALPSISPIKSDVNALLSGAPTAISPVNSHTQISSQKQISEGIMKEQTTQSQKLWVLESMSGLSIISESKNRQNSSLLWQVNQVPFSEVGVSLPQKIEIQTRKTRETITNLEVVKEKGKSRFAGEFNLSIQAAPDLSGIKLNQFGKAGQAIGIGAEYFLRPRLSIASGVYYSFKPYSSDEGYKLSYSKQPDRVIGECDILDIPFNLRFYPIEGKLQRVFASAGLSSYLMLKEHYKLEYLNIGTGYPYSKELEVTGANNHFFGVLNFSVGYERKLGNKLSVQVEPYFKVPITGVGEGDISLKSTGLFVGLKFYPNQLKK